MLGFGGYNPFGMQIMAAPPQMGSPGAYSPLNFGFSPAGPNGPPTTAGGFQNDPTPPPSSGRGQGNMGGFRGQFGIREPVNLSNGRDLYGAVAPQPQDQPVNPWSGNAGPSGYGPGGYNPWMSNLGAQGAMGMVNYSPFTGYFNNMAFNNVGPPNYDPNTLNQTQSYAGLARHLQGATNHYDPFGQRASSQGGGGGGYDAARGAAGAGAGWAIGAGLGSALAPGPGTLAGAGLGALLGFL